MRAPGSVKAQNRGQIQKCSAAHFIGNDHTFHKQGNIVVRPLATLLKPLCTKGFNFLAVKLQVRREKLLVSQ